MTLYKGGTQRNIPLSRLDLDKGNFRFDPVDSAKDALDVLINDQKTNLVNLAEDIMERGLNPADLIIAYPSKDSKGAERHVVVDGNRRLVSLLAILNPTIVPASMSTLRNRFEKLKQAHPELTGSEELKCIVFPDKASAELWIAREHSGKDDGRGTDEWDAVQKDRFIKMNTGIAPMAFAAWEFAKTDADDDTQRLMEKPKKYTNFERIVQSKPGRELLGVKEIKDDGTVVCDDEKLACGMLQTVIRDFETQKVNVNSIRTANDIRSYMTGVKERYTGKKVPRPKRRGRGRGSPRKALIPSKCVIPITDTKIVRIFDELSGLKVEDYPYAASLLLRSLLELSLDGYVKSETAFTQTLTDQKKKDQLRYRLAKLFEYLEKNPAYDKKSLIPYKKATLMNRQVLLTDELNAYVHDPVFFPHSKDLITTWDNIEGLMQLIWKGMSNSGRPSP